MTTCAWSCYFQDFASLVDLHSPAITVGCRDPSAPTLTLSIDAGLRAAAGGPALTIKNINPQLLGAGANGFVCTLPEQPLIVGPISPGTEQPATLSVGPSSWAGGTALNTLCGACGGRWTSTSTDSAAPPEPLSATSARRGTRRTFTRPRYPRLDSAAAPNPNRCPRSTRRPLRRTQARRCRRRPRGPGSSPLPGFPPGPRTRSARAGGFRPARIS